MIGAATEKLRDPKPVQTRGTSNKLEPEEHNVMGPTATKQLSNSFAARTGRTVANCQFMQK